MVLEIEQNLNKIEEINYIELNINYTKMLKFGYPARSYGINKDKFFYLIIFFFKKM